MAEERQEDNSALNFDELMATFAEPEDEGLDMAGIESAIIEDQEVESFDLSGLEAAIVNESDLVGLNEAITVDQQERMPQEAPEWNALRGLGKRISDITSGLVGFIDDVNDYTEQATDFAGGGFVWQDDDDSILPIWLNSKEYKEWQARPTSRRLLQDVEMSLEEFDAGYIPQASFDTIIEEFSENGPLSASAYGEVLEFGLETGVQSIADLVALTYAMPTYIVARSGEIGRVRAENNGRTESDIIDNLEAMPFAVGSALFDKIGLKGMTQAGKQTLGKEALKAGVGNWAKFTAKEAGKAAFKEAGTEAIQEGLIEYAGEHLGTKATREESKAAFEKGIVDYVALRFGDAAAFNTTEMFKRAAGGALAGGMMGGVGGGIGANINLAREKRLNTTPRPDDTLSAVMKNIVPEANPEAGTGDALDIVLDQIQGDPIVESGEQFKAEIEEAAKLLEQSAPFKDITAIPRSAEQPVIQREELSQEQQTVFDTLKQKTSLQKAQDTPPALRSADDILAIKRAEQVAKPIIVEETTARDVDIQTRLQAERDAVQSINIPPADTPVTPVTPVVRTGGKPYNSKTAAKTAARKAGVENFSIESIEGGFGYAPTDKPTLDSFPAIKKKRMEQGELSAIIKKAGGLNRATWETQDIDQTVIQDNARSGMFPKEGGLTPDEVREIVQENNFSQEDVSTTEAVTDLVKRSIAGEKIYTDESAAIVEEYEAVIREADEGQQFDLSGLESAIKDDTKFDLEPLTIEREAIPDISVPTATETSINQETVKLSDIAPETSATPEGIAKRSNLSQAFMKTDRDPTPGQIEAGNYAKGKYKHNGLEISIENPPGSRRGYKSKGGRNLSRVMQDPYGYIKRSKGADGDHVDVFIGPNLESDKYFVIDQINPDTKEFDEHKVIMGADTVEQAETIYRRNYSKNWRGFGGITEMAEGNFKEWVRNAEMTTKPVTTLVTEMQQRNIADQALTAEEKLSIRAIRDKGIRLDQKKKPPLMAARDYKIEPKYAEAQDFGDLQILVKSEGKPKGSVISAQRLWDQTQKRRKVAETLLECLV